jgi:UPF0271 protein
MSSAPQRINLNADMGESYGRYVLGADEALIRHVDSVNIACGYHAADPGTMLKSVTLAKRHGVELGAHISYPDLMGFGRRRMSLSEDEVFEISVYQIGALLGFCRAVGMPLTHVKPHGELYLTGVRDPATARGIVRAVRAIDPGLALLMSGPLVAAECGQLGVPMIHEGYVDLDYNADGSLILERAKAGRDPGSIATRAVRMLDDGGCDAIDGTRLDIPVQSICLHGDGPNAVQLAAVVRQRLVDAGYEPTGIRSLLAGAQATAGHATAALQGTPPCTSVC